MGGSRITLITFWEHSPSGGCFFVPIPLSTFLSLYPVHVAVGTPIETFTDGIVSHHPHRSPHPVSTSLPHIVPDRSGPFALGEFATIFGDIGNSWNLSETEIGVQRPSLHWQTLMHSESLQLFRSHGETRGAVKTYQKSVPIILIFVAIVFDSPFSCQNIFLGLIDCSSVDYDIFRIFAVVKTSEL